MTTHEERLKAARECADSLLNINASRWAERIADLLRRERLDEVRSAPHEYDYLGEHHTHCRTCKRIKTLEQEPKP